MREVNIAHLRAPEVVKERRRCSVVYQPIGPLEWHGPHLPIGTDPLRATDRVCAEMSDRTTRIFSTMPMITQRDGWSDWGHATRIETSVMMALQPDDVDLSGLPPKGKRIKNVDWGIVDDRTFRLRPRRDHTVCDADDPRRADAKAGGADLAEAARRLARTVRKALAETKR